jgi:hypothetical protein
VTAYPAWTPASRPGIIPLHPLTFGTILGRSFAALRQNPRVLLGFALVVQTVAYILVALAVVGVTWASFSRLDTLVVGTEEYDTVMAGSIGLVVVTGFVLGLAAGALSVIVQGIVVLEVTHAAVAEKLTLGALWRQLKPVAWRLIGYSLLVILAVMAVVALVVLGVIGVAFVAPPAAIGLSILIIVAAIPLTWWLMIKLLLAPSAIIVEHATILQALSRSWTLTRGRFWPALGVILVISVIFGAVAQVVSLPFSFVSAGLTTIIAPTGAPEPSAIIGVVVTVVLVQMVTLLLQAVAVVVQSTATALIYIDCRMRREGLDLDLLAYVERRDAGAGGLADPYREHVGRAMAPRGWAGAGYTGYPAAPGAPVYGAPAGQPVFSTQGAYPPAPGASADGAGAYPGQPGAYPGQAGAYGSYPAQPGAYPGQAGAYPVAAPSAYPPAAQAGAAPQPAPAPSPDAPVEPEASASPSPTDWAAPGAPRDAGRESPWS